jgi:hypothetical protein
MTFTLLIESNIGLYLPLDKRLECRRNLARRHMCQRDYLELLSKCELAFIEKVSNERISGLIKGKRPTIFYKFTRGYPLIPCGWPL